MHNSIKPKLAERDDSSEKIKCYEDLVDVEGVLEWSR